MKWALLLALLGCSNANDPGAAAGPSQRPSWAQSCGLELDDDEQLAGVACYEPASHIASAELRATMVRSRAAGRLAMAIDALCAAAVEDCTLEPGDSAEALVNACQQVLMAMQGSSDEWTGSGEQGPCVRARLALSDGAVAVPAEQSELARACGASLAYSARGLRSALEDSCEQGL
jgi:hypothetical protein